MGTSNRLSCILSVGPEQNIFSAAVFDYSDFRCLTENDLFSVMTVCSEYLLLSDSVCVCVCVGAGGRENVYVCSLTRQKFNLGFNEP